MKNNFFWIFLSPLAIFAVSEACFVWQKLFFPGLAISIILLFYSIKKMTGGRMFTPDFLWLLFVPAFFLVSSAAYALILPEKILIQIIFFGQLLFIFYFLKNLSGGIKTTFLENISSWGNFLSLFFAFSFLFGIKTFLGLPAVYSSMGFLLIIFLATAETFWANKISGGESLPFIFLIPLILLQLSWTLYFSPLNHDIHGLILTILYYMALGIIRPLLRENLSKKIIKFYLFGGLASIAVLLFTAKWI